jgi:hypothetical protein
MIPRNPTVVMHRPPLKRIGDARTRPVEAAVVDLGWEERYVEQQRIWGLLRQSAEGCNQVAVAE